MKRAIQKRVQKIFSYFDGSNNNERYLICMKIEEKIFRYIENIKLSIYQSISLSIYQ